jgi:hypothetical protein
MIQKQYTDRNNLEHLEKMARQNPLAVRIVYMIAENVFDDGFVLKDKDGEEHAINAPVQEEFTRLRFKHYFTMALATERWAGHSWLHIGMEDTEDLRIDTKGDEIQPRVAKLDFFSPKLAKVKIYDEIGAPKTLEITYQTAAGEGTLPVRKLMPAKDFILFRTRPFDRSHEGRSVLEPVWDFLVGLADLFHSIIFYAGKVGKGWLKVQVRNLTAEKRTAIRAMIEEQSPKRFLLHDKDIEDMSWIGASGSSINFKDYIDAVLDEVAAGFDVPLVALTGQAQGSISGGEGIQKALYSTINRIQGSVEPYIRETIARMGHTEEDYVVDWNTRYAHDEKEEAEIEVSKVSSNVARLQYMTMNEVRNLEGLDAIDGGDETPGTKDDFSIGVSGFGEEEPTSPSKQEQTRNKEGKQLG